MNYSVGVGNISDVDFNVTESTVMDKTSSAPCESGIALFRLVTEVYIVTPIAFIGFLGNILAFIVLCKHNQKLTTTVILQVLAIADILILATTLPLKTLYYSHVCLGYPGDYKEVWKMLFRVLFPLLFVFRMIDNWLIALLTLDRWIAVCKPLHAPSMCTRSSTYKRLAILFVVAVVFSLPRMFESTQYGYYDHEDDVTVLNSYRWYAIGYKIVLFFIGMYLIPMSLLIVLNIQLIMTLSMAKSSFMGRRHSQSQSISAQHRGITIIVVTVVSTCVVCNLLAMVSHILYSIGFFDPEFKETVELPRRFITQVSNVMIVVNSSINFVLYCFSSKNFRQITMTTFGCRNICKKIGYERAPRTDTYETFVSQRQSNGNTKENEIQLQKMIKYSK